MHIHYTYLSIPNIHFIFYVYYFEIRGASLTSHIGFKKKLSSIFTKLKPPKLILTEKTIVFNQIRLVKLVLICHKNFENSDLQLQNQLLDQVNKIYLVKLKRVQEFRQEFKNILSHYAHPTTTHLKWRDHRGLSICILEKFTFLFSWHLILAY